MTALDPFAIILRDGKKVDRLTDYALRRAEKRLGYTLTITQGSYNPGGVKASAGVHDKGGTVDLMPWDWQNKVTALRAVGFAAWFRPAIPGLWPAHIHAVLIDHERLSPQAAAQIPAYLARRSGLKSNLPDSQPGWTDTARYTVESFRADLARERITAQVARKRDQIAENKAEIVGWRARIRDLWAKRKALPK